MRIEKAGELGFCFGVRRAISILEKVAREKMGLIREGEVIYHLMPVNAVDQ